MTVNKLIKVLQKYQGQGRGRHRVSVELSSFHCNEDDAVSCLESVEPMEIHAMDGDGGLCENKDGTLRASMHIVLKGQFA